MVSPVNVSQLASSVDFSSVLFGILAIASVLVSVYVVFRAAILFKKALLSFDEPGCGVGEYNPPHSAPIEYNDSDWEFVDGNWRFKG